ALGTAALIGELAGHLLPAAAGLADQHVGRNEDAVEDDLVEILGASEVADRPYRDPRRFEVYQDLAQPGVAVALDRRGADERDHVVRDMGAAGPDLGAGELPAARHGHRAAADRGEVGTRIGFAHADAEIALAAADAGQEALTLR